MSDSLQLYRLQPARILCPWDSPAKNTEVDSRAVLQGIFQTQGWNPRLSCLLLVAIPTSTTWEGPVGRQEEEKWWWWEMCPVMRTGHLEDQNPHHLHVIPTAGMKPRKEGRRCHQSKMEVGLDSAGDGEVQKGFEQMNNMTQLEI